MTDPASRLRVALPAQYRIERELEAAGATGAVCAEHWFAELLAKVNR